jgi:hypothetical protein
MSLSYIKHPQTLSSSLRYPKLQKEILRDWLSYINLKYSTLIKMIKQCFCYQPVCYYNYDYFNTCCHSAGIYTRLLGNHAYAKIRLLPDIFGVCKSVITVVNLRACSRFVKTTGSKPTL